MQLKTLLTSKDNIRLPAKAGDVGYDLTADSAKVKGRFEDRVIELDILQLTDDNKWSAIDYIEYDTKVCIEPCGFTQTLQQAGLGSEEQRVVEEPTQEFFTILAPRSSNSKYNLTLCNSVGTVDQGYRGTLRFRYQYHFQPEDMFIRRGCSIMGSINLNKIYKVGDKIGQLICLPVLLPNLVFTHKLTNTERSQDGFGSTGK